MIQKTNSIIFFTLIIFLKTNNSCAAQQGYCLEESILCSSGFAGASCGLAIKQLPQAAAIGTFSAALPVYALYITSCCCCVSTFAIAHHELRINRIQRIENQPAQQVMN